MKDGRIEGRRGGREEGWLKRRDEREEGWLKRRDERKEGGKAGGNQEER